MRSQKFEVTFGMIEIYNEQVRDLLSKDAPPKGGLPVRENVGKGFFYVDGQRWALLCPVLSRPARRGAALSSGSLRHSAIDH